MKRVLTAILVLFGFACGDSQSLLTPEQFTRDIAQRFQHPDVAEVKVVEVLQVIVRQTDGTEWNVYLANAYKQYCREPSQKESVYRVCLDGFLAGMTDKMPPDPDSLVPVVKDRSWLDDTGARQPEAYFVFDEINTDLIVVYAIDSDDRMSYLSQEQLRPLAVPRKQLLHKAKSNLKRILPGIQAVGKKGFYQVTAGGGDYDSSLVLFESIWDRDNLIVDGEYLFSIPSRDTLMVTGTAESAELIQHLRETTRRVFRESPYALLDALFVYRDGQIERYKD